MKIDKIVFGCSEYYSPFWNIQSKIWKTKFGIEPICLLFGNKSKCNMSEEYGKIEECQFNSDFPDIIQLQFYKFYRPTLDENCTYIIGDIDQIPLQTEYFLNGLDFISENAYAHFNYTLCAQMRQGITADVFLKRGAYVNGGYDLPGHYHCAKGKFYKELYFKNKSFEDVLKYVIESKRYGMIKEDAQRNLNKQIHGSFWVAEEMYTSEYLWYGIRNKVVDSFYGKEYHIWDQKIDRVGNLRDSNGRWIPQWNGKNYIFDVNKLKNKGYVDIHCHRPYDEQETAMMDVLKTANMI